MCFECPILRPRLLHMRPHTAICVLILLYIKVRFDEDDEFKERARKEVVALQGGDSTSLAGNFLFFRGGGRGAKCLELYFCECVC